MRRTLAAAILYASAAILSSLLLGSPASACSDPNGHYKCGGGGFTGRTDFNASLEAMSPPRVHAPRKAKRIKVAGHHPAVKVKKQRPAAMGEIGLSDHGYLVSRARSFIGTNPTGWSRRWCGKFMEMIAPEAAARVSNPNCAKCWLALPRTSASVGAIAVLGRKGGGHIGVVTGFASNGDPIIVSGNAAGRGGSRVVAEGVYPRSRVLGYVSASLPAAPMADAPVVTPKLEQLAEHIVPGGGDGEKMTALALMAYAEIQPERPSTLALSALAHQPVGSGQEEADRAADLFGLPRTMMASFARIESGFKCSVKTGSYKGLYQLSDFEFRRYGHGDIWNCRDNAIAAAHKFVVEGINFERVTGRDPDFLDRYMIHQQGSQGAMEHATRPDRIAYKSMCATDEGKVKGERWCRKAIWGNVPAAFKRLVGSVERITSGQFVEFWRGRVNRLAQGLPAEARPVKVAKMLKKHHRYAHKKSKRKWRMAAR